MASVEWPGVASVADRAPVLPDSAGGREPSAHRISVPAVSGGGVALSAATVGEATAAAGREPVAGPGPPVVTIVLGIVLATVAEPVDESPGVTTAAGDGVAAEGVPVEAGVETEVAPVGADATAGPVAGAALGPETAGEGVDGTAGAVDAGACPPLVVPVSAYPLPAGPVSARLDVVVRGTATPVLTVVGVETEESFTGAGRYSSATWAGTAVLIPSGSRADGTVGAAGSDGVPGVGV